MLLADRLGLRAPSPTLRSRALATYTRLMFRPQIDRLAMDGLGLRFLRMMIDANSQLINDRRIPVSIRPITTDGVRGEWLRPRQAEPATAGVVLYLHGGGYVASSARAHRLVTAPLAALTGLPVFGLDYRLAPEHPFPAALDDTVAAYTWLLDAGVPAERIVVAGDSSGGHQAMSLLVALAQDGRPMPAGAVLFSPVLDPDPNLTEAREADALRRDPFISPAFVDRCARAYLGDHDPADPRLSPLNAGPDILRAMPPVLTYYGSTECFRYGGERLHAALTQAGMPNELRIVPGQIHDFVTLSRWVPEARQAMLGAAEFITTTIGAGAARPEGLPWAKGIRNRLRAG